MANNFYQNKKGIALALQMRAIQEKYPKCIISYKIQKATLQCKQRIKPTEKSREYIVTIEYKIGNSPEVFLINQRLIKTKEDILPHCYKQDFMSSEKECIKLCLYYPRRGEWDSSMFISDTIIPWAIEWLYFYELWRMTGEWYGGGEHPK